MRDPTYDDPQPDERRTHDWSVAVTIALAILICLIAFIWIFVQLEPFMTDFIGSEAAASPTATEPGVIPADQLDEGSPIATP